MGKNKKLLGHKLYYKKRSSKKAFTLVELIATIIIIGVLALVIIPSVSSTIKKAEKKTFTQSANGILRAATTYFAESGFTYEDGYCVSATDNDIDFDKDYQIKSGKICYKNGQAYLKNISNGKYCAIGNSSNLTIMEGDCDNANSYSVGDAIYLDPTDIEKVCNKESSDDLGYYYYNTHRFYFSGCMKWYVIEDSDITEDDVKLIMAHELPMITFSYAGSWMSSNLRDNYYWDSKINEIRSIELEEAENLGCSTSYDSCPSFLFENPMYWSFWTNTAVGTTTYYYSSGYAYYLDSRDYNISTSYYGNNKSIRPVIVVNKDYLEKD